MINQNKLLWFLVQSTKTHLFYTCLLLIFPFLSISRQKASILEIFDNKTKLYKIEKYLQDCPKFI